MLPIPTLRVLLSVPILLISLSFLAICASILIRQRPILLPGRAAFWVAAAALFLVIVSLIVIMVSASAAAATCAGLLQGLAMVFLLAFLYRRVQGYYLLGITETACRNALRSALGKLGLPYEETLTGFNLPSLRTRLRTQIASRMGTAEFRIEDRQQQPVERQIASQAGKYLLETNGSESFQSALIFGAFGLAFLFLAFYQWQRF